jgi:hypothetical protein
VNGLLAVVHLKPPANSDRMPCCGQSPFSAPSWHRLTTDPAEVTCAGKEN